MPPRKPKRRAEVLDAVLADLLQRGVADLSLRPLAARLGVSTYTLSYHFGAKEEMLRAALELLAARQREAIQGSLSAMQGEGPVAAILAVWDLHSARLEQDRLVMEAALLRSLDLGDEARRALTLVWVEIITELLTERGVPSELAEQEATLLNGLFLGLQIDLLVSGDHARVRRAVRLHAEAAAARWGAPPRGVKGGS